MQLPQGGQMAERCNLAREKINPYIIFLWRNILTRALAILLLRFLDHTQLDKRTRYDFSKRVIDPS